MRYSIMIFYAGLISAVSMTYASRPPAQQHRFPDIKPYTVLSEEGKDITNIILTNHSTSCASYVGQYYARADDYHNHKKLKAYLTISVELDECSFTSNAIPNHTYNNGDRTFPNTVSPQMQQFKIIQKPVFAHHVTPLSLRLDNAIFLNGVKVDLLAAGCYGVGDGHIGCNEINQPWRYDPAYKYSIFHIDQHNGHAQPGGAYHYHATPNALFSYDGTVASPVIGFAADGFPIYGSFIDDGEIRMVKSSYSLRKGVRPSGYNNPGGNYNGEFRDDYEYIEGQGDLDECNGMTRNGSYGYYVTSTFPYIINCFKGTPNASFNKKMLGHHRH